MERKNIAALEEQRDRVSIPFKREGTWKVQKNAPSGGWFLPVIVSIPFKREGTWKVETFKNFSVDDQFQFPSNGKVHGKIIKKGEIL